MKHFKSLVASAILITGISTKAQLNITELGYLDLVTIHNSDASDIWGYADNLGNEYAIVGLNDGTSVVDITDPANPTEVFYEPGMNSIWRDIKTYNGYAYVTTEAQNGLLIIDLNSLPGNTNLTTHYYTGPVGNEWQSAHNLYIDENGICYIFGANRDNGGTIMLDLTVDPINPPEVGVQDSYYTHDGVCRGDTLYQAHILDGFFTIYDISDKSNPVFLGQANTPGDFAHNLWFSDDGNYMYTTDEITNGFIGEYDISDPANIVELDKIQSSPGDNVIPHNAHFINDYIVTSYYRDGLVVHDVSQKGNMIEVGSFDTSPNFSGDGFNGCWGAFPWLPSGNVITADIEEGLHILGVNYTRGCYLEGTVTELGSGNPVPNVDIEIVGENIPNLTDAVGEYATGLATAGSYDVIYSCPGYVSDTAFNVTLNNGVTTTQNMQLLSIAPVTVSIDAEDLSNLGIEGVMVDVYNDDFSHNGLTDVNGNITFNNVIPGTYQVVLSLWGRITHCDVISILDDGSGTFTYTGTLGEGYYDDFASDLGWQVSGNAPDGVWEIGEPNPTVSGQGLVAPDLDYFDDCLDQAYVTGNSASGGAGADDVDIADMILSSPDMDLSAYGYPTITAQVWWQNTGGAGNPNDTLRFILMENATEHVVEEWYADDANNAWQEFSVNVAEYVTDFTKVKFVLYTSDWQADGGHLVEAGLDYFQVVETVSVTEELSNEIKVFPNPSNEAFQLELEEKSGYFEIYDLTGKLIRTQNINSDRISINGLPNGTFLLHVHQSGNPKVLKIVKI